MLTFLKHAVYIDQKKECLRYICKKYCNLFQKICLRYVYTNSNHFFKEKPETHYDK